MPRVISNYDVFAERGDPWDGTADSAEQRRLSPDGCLHLSRRAYLSLLKRNSREASPMDKKACSPVNVDVDRYLLASSALTLSTRLAKEKNTLVAPLSAGSLSISRSPLSTKLANARRKLVSSRSVKKA